MKNKFIKNVLFTMALLASISFSISTSVQAVSPNTTEAAVTINAETIPSHAEPGTNIKYDDNNKMQVLNGKIDDSAGNKSLPKPQPGMIVSYDGAGDPSFIKINGKEVDTQNDMLKASSGYSSGYYDNYGAISWFDDPTGQDPNHNFETYDCATDKDLDNCPLGTTIYAQDRDSGTWGTFHKWDIGRLHDQPEPRIVDVWNVYVFEDVYGIEDGNETGLLHNGYYYHY